MPEVRRIRVRARTPNLAPIKEELSREVSRVVELQEIVEGAQKALKEHTDKVELLMGQAKLQTFSNDDGVAEYVVPEGRSTTVVDIKKFYEAVDEKDFFAAAHVSVTAAREMLSGKEFAKISEKIPAEPKDPVLRIRAV